MKAPLTYLLACSLASSLLSVQGFHQSAHSQWNSVSRTSTSSSSLSLAATLLKNQEEIDEVNNAAAARATPRSYLESLSQANSQINQSNNNINNEPLQTSLDPIVPTDYSSSDVDLSKFDMEAYRQQIRDETETVLLQLQQEKQQAVQRLKSALQTTLLSMQQKQATRSQLAELKVQVQTKEIELLKGQLQNLKDQMVTDLQLTTQAKLAQQSELKRLRETEKINMLQQLQEQLNAKLMERQALMVEKEALLAEIQQPSDVVVTGESPPPVNGEQPAQLELVNGSAVSTSTNE